MVQEDKYYGGQLPGQPEGRLRLQHDAMKMGSLSRTIGKKRRF